MNIEFQKQFTGARTQGGDCGPTALIHLFHFATDDVLSPTQTEIREKGKIPDKEGFATNMADLAAGWNAMRSRAEKLGWKLGDFNVEENHTTSFFHALLTDGCGAILFVNYKTWNELLPKKSGDVDFQGMHAVFVSPEGGVGSGTVRVYDGMCDGRKDMPSGVTAPKGPQWIPWSKLMRCAQDYTSGNGITFGWAKKAKRIVKEEPVDIHAECKKQLTDCTIERKNLFDKFRVADRAIEQANIDKAAYRDRCNEWAAYADKLKAAIDGVPRP